MESIFQTDYKVVEASIDLLFEGRFEDGLDGSSALLDRHPGYPRLGIPMALMLPYDPFRVAACARAVDDALAQHGTQPADSAAAGAEPYALALLDFLDVHAGRFIAPRIVSCR